MKALAGKAADALARVGLLRLLESMDRSTDRVRIIAYHRVDEPEADPDLDPGLVSATPDDFRAQMEVVARHYNAITIDDLVAAHRGEKPLPQRAVLLTFDDGYRDFGERAWPILREVGLPAVLFVPTSFPDQPGPGFWWDRLHAALRNSRDSRIDIAGLGTFDLRDHAGRRAAHVALRQHVKSLPHASAMKWLDEQLGEIATLPSLHRVLGWDALRQLAHEGLAVCSHSHAHALCTRLAPDELAKDLTLAKRRIEEELGDDAPPPVFAYPSSANDAVSRRVVRDAGYELAFGGGRSIDRLPFADPYHITRLPMLRYATSLFRAQLRPSISDLGRLLIDGRNQQPA